MGYKNIICYFNPASAGNATDFGDQSAISANGCVGSVNSATRGVYHLGTNNAGTQTNIIEYITMGTTGNATDFGDLTGIHPIGAALSNTTVGFFCGGGNPDIDKITIASTGNATDFGNCLNDDGTNSYSQGLSGVSSSTRGVIQSGGAGSGYTNGYDYFTLSSGGNTSNFGDPTVRGTFSDNAYSYCAANQTIGLWYGGFHANPNKQIQKITIASTGNGTEYAQLGRRYGEIDVDSSTSLNPINAYGASSCNGSAAARG